MFGRRNSTGSSSNLSLNSQTEYDQMHAVMQVMQTIREATTSEEKVQVINYISLEIINNFHFAGYTEGSDELKSNKLVMLALIEKNPKLFKQASDELKMDLDIIELAVEKL